MAAGETLGSGEAIQLSALGIIFLIILAMLLGLLIIILLADYIVGR